MCENKKSACFKIGKRKSIDGLNFNRLSSEFALKTYFSSWEYDRQKLICL